MLQQHLVKGYICMFGPQVHQIRAQKFFPLISLLISVLPCFMLLSSSNLSLSSFLAGIRSWDVDLRSCDLDQQLQLFITRHSAHFSSEVRGQCDMALF